MKVNFLILFSMKVIFLKAPNIYLLLLNDTYDRMFSKIAIYTFYHQAVSVQKNSHFSDLAAHLNYWKMVLKTFTRF